jgi:DNA-binding HxlR family transcriptional regulator
MNWLNIGVDNCSIGRALDILGERWTFLVLREAFNGVRRFDEVCHHLGVSRAVLTERLATLVGQGILERAPYQVAGQRTRYEYRLTDKGRDLYPVLVALLAWGDRYAADPDGPAVVLEHRGCGSPVHLELRCDEGHALEGPRDVSVRPGPGAHIVPGPDAAAS